MTDSQYALLVMIVDRSGSMSVIKSDAEGMIETVVKEQLTVPGRTDIEIVQFDDQIDVPVRRTPITDSFTYELVPRGMTALHDAIGITVHRVGAELAKLDEAKRPGKVIVAIITDGLENSSREYSGDGVRALIEQQTNGYGWDFTFLGANQDAVLTASRYGIREGAALTFAATHDGLIASGDSATNYVSSSIRGQSVSYSDEDRRKAKGSE